MFSEIVFILSDYGRKSMSRTISAVQVRNNRMKAHVFKVFVYAGLLIIAYDFYLTYLTPFWDYDLLLLLFILGCALVFVGFSGKLWRRIVSRHQKIDYIKTGKCNSCGVCCHMPVRCLFLMKNRCLIHHNRPIQCRSFPSKPGQVVSHECGYYFEKK